MILRRLKCLWQSLQYRTSGEQLFPQWKKMRSGVLRILCPNLPYYQIIHLPLLSFPLPLKKNRKIKRIDREVRRRELANRAVAGNYARGSVSFEYVTGPDGNKYAVEGHINIDVRSVPNNPKATIRKAQAIRNIKLASGNSPQGRSVSAEVARMEREARMELKTEQRKESDDVTKAVETTDSTPSQNLILNYKSPFNPVESSLYILA